jgi:hypothetical protein
MALRKIVYVIAYDPNCDVYDANAIPTDHVMLDCGHDVYVDEGDRVAGEDGPMVECNQCCLELLEEKKIS